MEINLSKESFVDERTGEVSAPTEYLDNLRAVERAITHADDDITRVKSELKTLRDCREELVAKLRACVRDGKVLPLLEAIETGDDPDMVDDEDE